MAVSDEGAFSIPKLTQLRAPVGLRLEGAGGIMVRDSQDRVLDGRVHVAQEVVNSAARVRGTVLNLLDIHLELSNNWGHVAGQYSIIIQNKHMVNPRRNPSLDIIKSIPNALFTLQISCDKVICIDEIIQYSTVPSKTW